MKAGTVYVLLGMTGAGKSSIARVISRSLKLERLKTTTTRPKRDEEDNEYNFAKEEDFLQDHGRYIAIRQYNTLIEDEPKSHFYAVDKLEIEKGGLLITDFDGFKELCERGDDVVGIYIYADRLTRLNRSKKRAGFKEEEFGRRNLDDESKFSINRIVELGKKYPIYIVGNSENTDLKSAITRVEQIIKEHI